MKSPFHQLPRVMPDFPLNDQSRNDSRPVPTRIVFSYILDYVIIIVLVVIFAILDKVEPHHQRFSLQDISLQHPYAVHERVPIWAAVCCSIGAPAVCIVITTLFIDGLFSHTKHMSPVGTWRIGRYSLRERLWQLNCGILGLLLAQSLAFVVTSAIKNACGRPRPDIIDRCQPYPGSHDRPVYGLSDYSMCSQTDKHKLKDGFRSFPSGHSSSSFAGLFYFSLYLGGKLHVLDARGEVWKTVVFMAPTLGAGLIAISRIMDSRHHPFDVITGSLLGLLCGWAGYRQFFPQLSDYRAKGRAYPIRKWGSEPTRLSQSTSSDEVKLTGDAEEYRPRPNSVAPDYLEAGTNRRRIPPGSDEDFFPPTADERISPLATNHYPPAPRGQSIEMARM